METKQTHNHIVGDTVKVYEDPITKEELEGKAVIIKLRHTEHYYDVQFLDDLDEPEAIFGRFIY